jgi:hypothetical protein
MTSDGKGVVVPQSQPRVGNRLFSRLSKNRAHDDSVGGSGRPRSDEELKYPLSALPTDTEYVAR